MIEVMGKIKFYLMMLLLLVPMWGQAQEKLFNKYSDMKGVKSVYISKAMLEMGPHLFSNIYVGSASKRLNSVSLLSTSKNEAVYKDLMKDIRSLLKSSKFELLMKQKGENTTSEFYITRSGSKIKELIMFTEDGVTSLRFVYLEGLMTMEDVKNILLYTSSASLEHSSGLENLQALQSLKGLDSLKELESLKDLRKYFDSDTWKQFGEQMKDLGKQLKDLDVDFAN